MPIIFQNFRHQFLELFCAEPALNVRYMEQKTLLRWLIITYGNPIKQSVDHMDQKQS